MQKTGSSTSQRLQRLRQQMRTHGLDYYLVPSTDEHCTEYVAPCWGRRGYCSNFNGSNGDLVVGLEGAWLWTDSRYFLQAEQQLDSAEIQLMRMGEDPALMEWLVPQASSKALGCDSKLVSIRQHAQWQQLAQKQDLKLHLLDDNLVDAIWDEQPPIPESMITAFPLKYAGLDTQTKIEQVRTELGRQNADYVVLNLLDDIAWLTNLRGQDAPTTPIFFAYMVVGLQQATLYVKASRLDQQAQDSLAGAGVSVCPPEQLETDLAALSGRVWLDPQHSSYWLLRSLSAQATCYQALSPVRTLKAIKNEVELAGMHEAHCRDAVAIIQLFSWLESHWAEVDEMAVAAKLEALRQQDPLYQGVSFNTISGYGAHGAIVHYAVQPETSIAISDDNLFLLDMGGQYLCGTTDATRVLHFGTPTAAQRRDYTLVLKGHLALRHTEFQAGTCGEDLDPSARAPLKAVGLNYGHGTGHGVGCYLEVHEGPQKISPYPSGIALQPGMVVSNEPGVYHKDQYGIRIENLVHVIAAPTPSNALNKDDAFYTFKDLTLLPYHRDLIDVNLLTAIELDWINQYHQWVAATLMPRLSLKEQIWLRHMTQPIELE